MCEICEMLGKMAIKSSKFELSDLAKSINPNEDDWAKSDISTEQMIRDGFLVVVTDDEPEPEITFEQMVGKLAKAGVDIIAEMTPEQAHIMHMNWGLGGEVGELSDALKKHVIYGKELDRINVIEELGDIEFYLEGLRQGLHITREETLEANKAKLLTGKNARYAGGLYTNAAAKERADKS